MVTVVGSHYQTNMVITPHDHLPLTARACRLHRSGTTIFLLGTSLFPINGDTWDDCGEGCSPKFVSLRGRALVNNLVDLCGNTWTRTLLWKRLLFHPSTKLGSRLKCTCASGFSVPLYQTFYEKQIQKEQQQIHMPCHALGESLSLCW